MPSLHLPLLTHTAARPVSLSTWASRLLMVALAYYAGGHLGLAVPQSGSPISLISAPAGIAVAAFLRWGTGIWPAVWLAAFFVALSVDSPPWLALSSRT